MLKHQPVVILLAFAVFAVSFFVAAAPADEALRPNIIFILVDDLGYNDLSFNGQENFTTPNLDRMAGEGLFLAQHYTGSTVCAPSRAALLTGNHTGRVYQRGNVIPGPPRSEIEFRADPHDITIASRLQHAGYHTAMIGKSGVACNSDNPTLPNEKGFDHFFGYLAHRDAHRHYPQQLTRNGEAVSYPDNSGKEGEQYAGDLLLDDALRYIKERSETEEPFFLHFAMQQPHADLAVPAEFRDRFVGKFDDETPHPEGRHYRAESHPKATYAAMVAYADDAVGQLLEELRELGLAENTLVIFASDNGSHTEGGYHYNMHQSNAPFRGGKRDLYEGGIRTPTIAWWPGTIEPGTRSEHPSAFWDFAPTALQLAGLPVPEAMDGISYVPTLLGQHDQQQAHPYLYWEFYEQGGKQAVRHENWKAVRLNANQDRNAPIELYNLAEDPGESQNIAGDHPEIVEKLDSFMRDAHQPHEHFRFGS
ncbi:MAG: arylsulfatase [Phycisphaeraceae bacterium]